MSEVDWNDAPEWADRLMRSKKGDYFWCNVEKYMCIDWPASLTPAAFGGRHSAYTIGDLKLIEMRPGNWKEGERRMEPIGQNGNEGEHYAELDNFNKQPRYKGDDGLDWIDEFARDNSIEDFRAAMRFTIGKYEKRLGKKDAMSKELYKMSDYYNRWSEVEKSLENDK